MSSVTRPIVVGLLGLSVWAASTVAPATAHAEPKVRKLVFAAGKARKELKPILEILCRRASEGELSDEYGDVLLLGDASDLGQTTATLPPGVDEEVATDFFNVLRAVDHELVGCPPSATRRRVEAPADVLFLDITFSAAGKINIELKQFRSEGTLWKSERLTATNAFGINLTSSEEAEAFVGCVGWALWKKATWIQTSGKCQQWGMDEPVIPPPPQVTSRTWTRKRAAYAVGGAAVLSVGVGGIFAWRAASQVQHCRPCDATQGASNDAARTSARIADVGLGLAVVTITTATYLWLTARDEPQVAAGATPGASVGAAVVPSGGLVALSGSW